MSEWMRLLQGEPHDEECDHCGSVGSTEDRPPRGYLCEDCCTTLDAAGEPKFQGMLGKSAS